MIFCADFKIISGPIFARSTCESSAFGVLQSIVIRTGFPSFSVVVIWMYNRTSLFSLGMTMTLPEFDEWIAHLIRMSAEED
jgi:hypothetical protein